MSQQGPSLGSSASGWNNSANVLSDSDNLYADVNSLNTKLFVTGFGFNVPVGATIQGVQIDLHYEPTPRPGFPPPETIDMTVGITLNGTTVAGTPIVYNAAWVGQEQSVGDSTTLFGSPLTVAQVNASTFGAVAWVSGTYNGANPVSRIGSLRMSVFYSLAGGGPPPDPGPFPFSLNSPMIRIPFQAGVKVL